MDHRAHLVIGIGDHDRAALRYWTIMIKLDMAMPTIRIGDAAVRRIEPDIDDRHIMNAEFERNRRGRIDTQISMANQVGVNKVVFEGRHQPLLIPRRLWEE